MPLDPDEAMAHTAARWVAAKDRGLNSAESKALLEWLSEPRHGAEFARILRTWRGLDGLGERPEMTALADAVERRVRQRRRRRAWAMASGSFAAAAAIAAACLIGMRGRWAPPAAPAPAPAGSYVVLANKVQRSVLADGSVAELNGDALIETDFVPQERRVRLVRGEANFIVAKNRQRPFIVSAGPVVVRAVGTAFSVRLAPGKVEVLVSEGKVRLSDGPAAAVAPAAGAAGESAEPSLVANERAVVDTARPAGTAVTIDHPTPAEFDAALAWRSTRLVFDHTPLDQVVAAFNRYNAHKLALSGPSLRARTLTGIFRTDNLAGFIRLLPAIADVVAEPGADGATLLRPAP